ncbi:MAG: GNAT family N-acetyltransferase [Pseudomonadota bacterium]
MTGTDVHIPTLTTERLILRAPQKADFEAYCAFMTSDRSHIPDPNVRTVWHLFATEFFGWCLNGIGHWIIALKNGPAIGVTGLSHPAYYPEPEMGWALYDGFEGQGYATEAARAARGWASGKITSLVSYIAPGNARSVAVARRLGAWEDPEATLPTGTLAAQCSVFRHWGDS